MQCSITAFINSVWPQSAYRIPVRILAWSARGKQESAFQLEVSPSWRSVCPWGYQVEECSKKEMNGRMVSAWEHMQAPAREVGRVPE